MKQFVPFVLSNIERGNKFTWTYTHRIFKIQQLLLQTSVAFVSPLYFEPTQRERVNLEEEVSPEDGSVRLVNRTSYELTVTEFRTNSHYIFWYKNVATFVVTILVPLALLVSSTTTCTILACIVR